MFITLNLNYISQALNCDCLSDLFENQFQTNFIINQYLIKKSDFRKRLKHSQLQRFKKYVFKPLKIYLYYEPPVHSNSSPSMKNVEEKSWGKLEKNHFIIFVLLFSYSYSRPVGREPGRTPGGRTRAGEGARVGLKQKMK